MAMPMLMPTPPEYRRRMRRRRRGAAVFQGLCLAAVGLALAMLAALLYSVLTEAWAWFNLDGASISTLLTDAPSSKAVQSGLFPAIVGTLWVMVICAFISFTVGVSTAIYMEEYAARNRFNELIQTNIQNLAAVPSIVYGILGLSIFVALFALGKSTLAAGLTLALLIMPVVIVSSQEAIKAVPSSIREGGYALGATRWQVVWRLTLPQAMPGHPDGHHPGGKPGYGRGGAAGDYGRPVLRAFRPHFAAGPLYGAAHSNLCVDFQAAGGVSPAGGGGHRGAAGHPVEHERLCDTAAEPATEPGARGKGAKNDDDDDDANHRNRRAGGAGNGGAGGRPRLSRGALPGCGLPLRQQPGD